MGKAYPVLTSETSVQDPQTACMHSQSSDFAQVYNTRFTVLTALPTAPARTELADFCHSKFLLRHKPLITQVHLAFMCLRLLAKPTEHLAQIFIFRIEPDTKHIYEILEVIEITSFDDKRS